MKKLYYMLFAALTVMTLTCCGKDDNDELTNGISTKEKSWATLVETYPFLSAFPAYDGEIDIHNYNNSFGSESLSFFDYDCERAGFDAYKAKVESAGFTQKSAMESGNQSSLSYEKENPDGKLSAIITYSGGNFSAVLSKLP